VSTVLDDSGGLRPGDRVYLDSREVGSVTGVTAAAKTPGFTIEFGLYPEHAELVQANAIAYIPLKSPPMVVLENPVEEADPVAPNGRLRGLSPMEAAVWQANEAADSASEFMAAFARKIDRYFESEDWQETRAEIDAGMEELATESRTAADRIADAFRELVDTLNEAAARGSATLEDEVAGIEHDIAKLKADGHEELAASLQRLLDRIESMAPPEEPEDPNESPNPP
jgi:ABC-type transporter Mla subunit MlaD